MSAIGHDLNIAAGPSLSQGIQAPVAKPVSTRGRAFEKTLELLSALNLHQVEYKVVGGVALVDADLLKELYHLEDNA